ncbi:MAG: DUF1461 domain-containing protein [Cellvibrio sp.]
MRLPSYLIWPLIFVGQLLATSLLAWHLLAQINFAYPTGYKLLDLDKHIAEFAPLNRHIHGFEFVQPKEHWKLFAQITDAVQHNGEGLADISFVLPNNTKMALMHSAEIIHLQDVSHLINKFYVAGGIGAMLWIVFFSIAYRQKLVFPKARNIVLGFCGGIFTITAIILSIGATKVFYWLHTKVFPEGHQWFFYYEDSLMTTLMKAPDIFAFIACLLLCLLIFLWALSTLGMARLLKNNPVTTPVITEANTARVKSKKKNR